MLSSGDNNPSYDFIIIGTGNVGTQLVLKLHSSGFQPVQIISRSFDKARKLAKHTGCVNYSTELRIHENARFIIIAVSDDQIKEVLGKIDPGDTPVFHCSGSTFMSVFPTKIPHHGVFYPLQTLSLNRTPDFNHIPFLLEASDMETMILLREIAGKMGSPVLEVNSDERLKYHIAAVFASNFCNHFLKLAADYLRKNDLPPEILTPLIRETFEKFIDKSGMNVQTGPAYRGDHNILGKHEEMLKNDPDFQKIYTFVSNSIIRYKKENN